ncbi:hypothetical protein IAR55_002100 [Kwoniella newhampshirensis]|uniref:SH3 domain-containing protein n=1 Tax=Kwoniella newhampshirensis TaxID=1651941 RepID=A0AAW0Z0K3_9TREE
MMDPGYVLRHPVFLVTFIIAIAAWVIAFAGQCAAEAKFSSGNGKTPVVGTLWFTIWVELAVIIHLLQLLISQLVWILSLTSEEDTFFYNLLNSGGNGGLSTSNRRIGGSKSRRDSASAGFTYGGETGISGNGGVRALKTVPTNIVPDDPNEVSFAKGDILEVMDNTGKWFQVRTPTGATGIAPSNYLTML